MLSMNGKHHCHPQRGLSAARSATRAAARASEQLPCSSRARDATAGEQHRTANRDAGLLQGTTAWSRRSAANPARRRAAAASGARRRARERTAAVREPLPCARRDGRGTTWGSCRGATRLCNAALRPRCNTTAAASDIGGDLSVLLDCAGKDLYAPIHARLAGARSRLPPAVEATASGRDYLSDSEPNIWRVPIA